MKKLYLSKRNLLTLLSKLDRQEQGQTTACTLIKYANPNDPYVNSIDCIAVIAVPDDQFYANRNPGEVHPFDEPSGA